MFVCWFVCLLFFGHTTFVHFAALPPSGRESRSRRRGRPRARRGQACTARARASACRTTSQRKNRCADAFQKQNRTRAHAVVYVTAEIFKKREKENQHATSQVQFTVCLLLECLLFESYRIVLDLWSEPTLVSSCIIDVGLHAVRCIMHPSRGLCTCIICGVRDDVHPVFLDLTASS